MVDYSFIDIIRNSFSLLYTKLFFHNARLVRWPFYISGKKGFEFDKGLTTGRGCRFGANPHKKSLFIGKDARIGDYVHINADYEVRIGDNVLMASKIFISDTNHGEYNGTHQSSPYTNPSQRDNTYKSVCIGDNVWIGENVVILPGSCIGNGCVIGANSVITGQKFDDNCIIVGTPGRVVKKYNITTESWERIL